MSLAAIPIKLIAEGTRLRQADDAQVAALIASIRDVGLLNPITVYPRKVICDNVSVDGFGLVAGLHRYTACKALGFTEIQAHVVTLGELQRQIAECDENLCGPRLTPSEKALFTMRRKQAYEALHGNAKENRAKLAAEARWNDPATDDEDDACGQVGHKQDARFDLDQAAKTGESSKNIRRNAERGEKIGEEILGMLAGTHLDSGAYMDGIKGLTAIEQRAKVTADLDKRRRDAEAEDRKRRQADDAVVAAEYLISLIGRSNIAAFIAAVESAPLKRIIEEMKR